MIARPLESVAGPRTSAGNRRVALRPRAHLGPLVRGLHRFLEAAWNGLALSEVLAYGLCEPVGPPARASLSPKEDALVGLKPVPELNPTSCPECGSLNIAKEAEEPRQPIVMRAAWSQHPQTPGDIATQTWRCSVCRHEWVAVETYPPEQP